jgi:hypothetical protein
MPVVWMVQMPVDEIVNVVPVRNSLVTAPGSVDVVCVVSSTGVVRCAADRVGLVNVDPVLVDVALVGVVQVAVVEIVHVITVLDGGVTAVGSVLMLMVRVLFAAHGNSPFSLRFPFDTVRADVEDLPCSPAT